MTVVLMQSSFNGAFNHLAWHFDLSVQVVCNHAISVPPTSQLSAEVKGYLPVHCMHQLIRMRNFRKYNISIKVCWGDLNVECANGSTRVIARGWGGREREKG